MLFSAFVQVLLPESSHHLRVVIIKIICKAETSGRLPFFEKVMKADFFFYFKESCRVHIV